MKVEGRVDDKRIKDDSMTNNFLLISLEENKAKKIAEAINNPTGRKILDALAKKDYTESDLSKELGIPISTVHYNLKQLMEANLVVIEEFHYSQKGKEVNHYRLANKYIIIAPKSESSRVMEALQKVLPLGIITIVAGGLLTAWSYINPFQIGSAPVASQKAIIFTSEAASSASAQASAADTTSTLLQGGTEISRPFLQSEMVAWFFVGALSIIIIYFLYELVRKK